VRIPKDPTAFLAPALGLVVGACPALADSPTTTGDPNALSEESTKTRPAPAQEPRLGTYAASSLDAPYDEYLEFKRGISDNYNLDFSLDFSIYPQTAAPNGGKPIWLFVYSPNVTWKPFTNTAVGSGQIDFVFQQQAFTSSANTETQAARLGLITFPSDWASDGYSWYTIAYTHTLPGDMNWLSFTGGQYNLFSFDPNEYAANAQIDFIGYSFAQDATQTFPNAGLGGYMQATLGKGGQFRLASGFQGAANPSGQSISVQGYQNGELLYWGNAQWTPNCAGWGQGIYSLLAYHQPFIPMISDSSTGISFSASQEITEQWGAFLRLSNATGNDLAVRASIAFGGVRNDPFGHNPSDQAGLGFAWNKTNHSNVGMLPGGIRDGEWTSELYYRYTVFKGLSLTPDVQIFFNPSLAPQSGAAVFTLRSTLSF
jgi:Carbohydrate-selective porin, OprB family